MKHGSSSSSSSLVVMVHPEVLSSKTVDDQQHRPPVSGRRRSVSVADTSPSVETVMSKAKRAAISLWMLLHSQNCVLGQKCPHTGCQEAKLLHLHLKTCHAVGDAPCPLHYHGCNQSRKLLAHYRRCRQLRLTSKSNAESSSSPPHHCLVCSLVARQARTFLTSSSSSRKVKANRKQVTYAAGDSLSRLYGIAKQLDGSTMSSRRARSKSDGDILKCKTIAEESEVPVQEDKEDELEDDLGDS